MTIKRILVHFDHQEEHMGARLDAAISLAHHHGAQLHGLFVINPDEQAVEGRGASLAYLAETRAALKEKSAVIDAAFKNRCERERLSWTWSCVEGDTLKVLTEYSYCADLTLVGQQQSSGLDDAISLHRSDYLPLLSPGPVLIIPRDGRIALPAKFVLIAWKPDRSCARALHDALPFLAAAETVTLLTVDPPSDWALPDTVIGEYLAAHGVQVAIEVRKSGMFKSVSEVMLGAAKDMGADMLVMGAHGHSRLAELIFGGATHDVLRNMHLPVLMSH